MIARKLLPTLLIILIVFSPTALAFKGLLLSQHAKRLADDLIEEFVETSTRSRGTEEIGKRLGAMALPDEVLEDTFLRIAFAKQIITGDEAATFFSRLTGVKGFGSALRKAVGNNPNKTKGHVHELRVATLAQDQGFEIKEIGRSFTAGTKQWTDIDLVLEKNGKTLLVEAKDYAPTTPLNLANIRADMQALIEYAKTMPDVPTVPIFTISNAPASTGTLKLLQQAAERRNVQLLFGNPTELALRLKMLEAVQ